MFRWTTWFTKYGGPTEHKWSNRTQVVQAERPRHDMRDTAPPCGTIGERNGVGRRNRPSSDAVGPFLAEMSAPLSRAAVGTAFSRAKCTPDTRRRLGVGCRDPRGRAPGGRSRGPARPIGMPPWSSSGSRRPSRGPQRRGLSKSVAKARVEPRCTRKNVDIPHFLPWSIPARSAFATDLDTPRPGPSQEPHPHHGCVS